LAALAAFLFLVGIVALDTYRYLRFLEVNNLSPTTDKGAYEPHRLLPLHDYQRNRLLAFVAPERIDPMGISWNLRQSLISVGSGGFAGKGWAAGTQARLGYLPRAVAHNDFIFSVIAEEKGFLGSISVLGLFGVVLWNGIRIAGLARDRFGTLLAIGVTVLLAVHVFVNIAMTLGLVPITGIPLPFISYGGSFVLSCCVLQGLVQSVYRFRKEF
jgi:rod shape determining protein RodA